VKFFVALILLLLFLQVQHQSFKTFDIFLHIKLSLSLSLVVASPTAILAQQQVLMVFFLWFIYFDQIKFTLLFHYLFSLYEYHIYFQGYLSINHLPNFVSIQY